VVGLLADPFELIFGLFQLLAVLLGSSFKNIYFFFVVLDTLFECFSIDLSNNRFNIFLNISFHHFDLIERFAYDSFFNRVLLVFHESFLQHLSSPDPFQSYYLLKIVHLCLKGIRCLLV